MTRLLIEHEDAARRRLALLELADELGDAEKACEIFGYSKSSFYLFKRLYGKYGEQGLRSVSRQKPNFKNRVSPEIEEAVIAYGLTHPMDGQQRASDVLRADGINVSASGVRSIWLRHGLQSAQKRVRAGSYAHRFLPAGTQKTAPGPIWFHPDLPKEPL